MLPQAGSFNVKKKNGLISCILKAIFGTCSSQSILIWDYKNFSSSSQNVLFMDIHQQ